ncbi:SDR family oxidoreductase [Halococcoides cellulosivorans]|uniref:NAD(P)-dependent oxidoreductase n=1 Tax=Halococcoides cellulosivorans TaxID=1679096 RepID=A0A2R4X0N3_9EURY|nr:SDR family oxidoreductase [Halococcoides cellulosivorans]AWB27336.1 NAD(P)-dependent oxidoreductase [Halococcoides cellulosivorans]
MTERILVTGATGTVGHHVVSALADRDVEVRSGVRDPESVPAEIETAGATVAFDFSKPETWGAALADVDQVFLMRPPTVDTAAVISFVDAADRVGVTQIAYLSTLGAETNVLVPHHRIEKHVLAADLDATLLRASFFMQNLLGVHRRDIVENDEILVPAGTGTTSFVDARDVGEVAATVVTEAGHANQAYDLTGPEALDYDAVAMIFADVLDRPISYSRPSLFSFAWRMYRRGHPLTFVALMCGIYTVARVGLAARVSSDCRRILGREPRSVRTFVEDYASEFRAESVDSSE